MIKIIDILLTLYLGYIFAYFLVFVAGKFVQYLETPSGNYQIEKFLLQMELYGPIVILLLVIIGVLIWRK